MNKERVAALGLWDNKPADTLKVQQRNRNEQYFSQGNVSVVDSGGASGKK